MNMHPDLLFLDTTVDMLREILGRGPLRDRVSVLSAPATSTETDGWYRSVGNVVVPDLRIEAWFDHWCGCDQRVLWYGVVGGNSKTIRDAARRASSVLGAPIRRGKTALGVNGRPKTLDSRNFCHPVQEVDVSGWHYYGEYLKPHARTPRVVRGAAEAANRLIAAVLKAPLPRGGAFPEGTALRRSHLARERNSAVVRRAKRLALMENGHLACEACGFDFSDIYGRIGEDFIEAHHLTPLASLEVATETHIQDLALVCANCHRMLHRYRPWLARANLGAILSRASRDDA